MDYPNRVEWQTRCEFNAYCKRALRNELIDACRERKRRQLREVIFSDLTPQEERQLYTVDKYFQDGNEEAFCAGGLKITAKLLAEALHTLPDEKRQAVLLYYFFNMTDVEIAEAMKIPRSTVQYRRTSSFELLKRFLEERAISNNSDERGLLPYPVILAATKGDPDAMKLVLQHYQSYIAHLSMQKIRDESGNTYWGIDEDLRERLQAKLMRAVLNFKAD